MNTFSDFALSVPDILLPKNIDTASWSCIACDQYTQDRNYWKEAEKAASGKPSALNLILPEVYLGDGDKESRIAGIQAAMRRYIDDGLFEEKHGFVYVERTTAFGRMRRGLIAAIDLDRYEWKPFSKALIRATEATIPSRIPPRKAIRSGAPLEVPHIMLLVNDASDSLVGGTGKVVKASGAAPLYSGNLMMKGGSIQGRLVPESSEGVLLSSLEKIAKANTESDGSVFMFAVGDGNHSLATAKAVWDEYKQRLGEEERKTSRVRYALVEIVNIYDAGLTFEPIHRVLFGADAAELILRLTSQFVGEVSECRSSEELENAVKKSRASFGFASTSAGKTSYTLLKTNISSLAVSAFQPVVDDYIAEKAKAGIDITIDYIHGDEETMHLGAQEGTTGILLPPIDKTSFFATIEKNGPLPRKSFSMGEADEKRFYLECRKLF